MDLYNEILMHFSGQNSLEDYSDLIIEMHCYMALRKIKAVIEDDSFDDPTCFQKIEEIICILESLGSSGGFRHDFG